MRPLSACEPVLPLTEARTLSWRLAWLLVPLISGYVAWRTGILALKLAVPASCALLLVWGDGPFRRRREVGWVVLAFAASLVGDTFLSLRAGRESFYIAGIAVFFVAHLGYLGFALRNGRLHRAMGLVLLVGYLGWFLLQLGPAIPSWPLKVAALAYLLISCTALAAAWGLRLPSVAKVPYVAGIGLIVFSDTLIALSDFLKVKGVSFLILPTYYLAQILVTWAVHSVSTRCWRPSLGRRERGLPAASANPRPTREDLPTRRARPWPEAD